MASPDVLGVCSPGGAGGDGAWGVPKGCLRPVNGGGGGGGGAPALPAGSGGAGGAGASGVPPFDGGGGGGGGGGVGVLRPGGGGGGGVGGDFLGPGGVTVATEGFAKGDGGGGGGVLKPPCGDGRDAALLTANTGDWAAEFGRSNACEETPSPDGNEELAASGTAASLLGTPDEEPLGLIRCGVSAAASRDWNLMGVMWYRSSLARLGVSGLSSRIPAPADTFNAGLASLGTTSIVAAAAAACLGGDSGVGC